MIAWIGSYHSKLRQKGMMGSIVINQVKYEIKNKIDRFNHKLSYQIRKSLLQLLVILIKLVIDSLNH